MTNFLIPIILGSGSPRRKQLLEGLGLNFTVKIKPTKEQFPINLKAGEIPLYLCKQKALAFTNKELDGSILITADTIVWVDNQVFNKPVNEDDAIIMLQKLSGRMHEVYTGVCIRKANEIKTFTVLTKVYFKNLSLDEITHYVKCFKPYDKAGAYGAQEWMGYIAIQQLDGSYFNVMGLPTMELWEHLKEFK